SGLFLPHERTPAVQISRSDDPPVRVGHVPVPDPAELRAADLKTPQLVGRHVEDVVDARVGVRLDTKLVGPEGMDDVKRSNVQLNWSVEREIEMGSLHPAVIGIAVGEVPLLGDHLDLQLGALPAGGGAAGLPGLTDCTA